VLAVADVHRRVDVRREQLQRRRVGVGLLVVERGLADRLDAERPVPEVALRLLGELAGGVLVRGEGAGERVVALADIAVIRQG
jgi:hypothetical protein